MMLEKKICKYCHVEKNTSDFPSKGRKCKACVAEYKKEHYLINRVEIRNKHKEYYRKNSDKIRKYVKDYIIRESSKVRDRKKRYYNENKEAINQWKKNHIRNNREKYSESWKRIRERRKDKIRAYLKNKSGNDEVFKLSKNIRSRIRFALKKYSTYKSAKTVELLGCSVHEFKVYFESLFNNGMSWGAFMRGEIHIDHKKPCALFDLKDPEQQKSCFHYSNLQPLWKLDNLRKGISYNENLK